MIHTAYRQDGDGAREIVVDGSENVARAAAAVGARLVHLSTDVVFDGRKGAPYVEDDTPSPCTDYGRAKAEAEERVARRRARRARSCAPRSSSAGRARASKHELAARNPEATFFDDEIRSPGPGRRPRRALLELAELESPGRCNVAGADDVSRADLAELVTGRTVRRAPAPPGRPLDCALDSSRARGLLATRLRGVREVFALERLESLLGAGRGIQFSERSSVDATCSSIRADRLSAQSSHPLVEARPLGGGRRSVACIERLAARARASASTPSISSS